MKILSLFLVISFLSVELNSRENPGSYLQNTLPKIQATQTVEDLLMVVKEEYREIFKKDKKIVNDCFNLFNQEVAKQLGIFIKAEIVSNGWDKAFDKESKIRQITQKFLSVLRTGHKCSQDQITQFMEKFAPISDLLRKKELLTVTSTSRLVPAAQIHRGWEEERDFFNDPVAIGGGSFSVVKDELINPGRRLPLTPPEKEEQARRRSQESLDATRSTGSGKKLPKIPLGV
jgi:hypothetical protein